MLGLHRVPVSSRILMLAAGLCAILFAARAQSNTATRPGQKGRVTASPAAIAAAKLDPAAVARGEKLFTAKCGECHGNSAKGTDLGPNLVYSLLVLRDENGASIIPVLRNGRPDQGMPKPDLTEAQISDLVTWLHAQTYAADHRIDYAWQDVVTGDPKKGEVYFKGAGKCSGCHSATGDLAGIGKKYDPFTLQSRWVKPGPEAVPGSPGAPAPDTPRGATRVTVTLPSGESVSGTLIRISDFDVSLRDASGEYRSFTRQGDSPQVVLNDPLKTHKDLLRQYSDADIHNMTAFLVTLQ